MPPPRPNFRYFFGRPFAWRAYIAGKIFGIVGCLPFLLAALYCFAFYWEGLRGHLRAGPVVALCLSGAFVLLFGSAIVVGIRQTPQILPVYEKRLGDTDTWLNGCLIARNSRRLDEAAVRIGVTPLSAFGYDEPEAWHTASEGLRTVRGLVQLIAMIPGTVDDAGGVRDELLLIEDALSKADSRGIRFRLNVRASGMTCAAEHEQLKGSYF